MKRLPYIALAVVLLLVGWAVLHPTGPKEPSYQGRRLSEWMNDYLDSGRNRQKFPDSAATRQAASHAVKEMGTNAIPTLLLWAQATDSPVKLRLNALLDRLHYIRFRFKTTDEWNLQAQVGFYVLGNDAMLAVPELMRLLKSPEPWQRWVATDCLVAIDNGNKVLLPTFIQVLDDQDKETRMFAATFLHEHYPEAAEKAGVYKLFPDLKPSVTNTVPTHPPAAQ